MFEGVAKEAIAGSIIVEGAQRVLLLQPQRVHLEQFEGIVDEYKAQEAGLHAVPEVFLMELHH